MIHLYYLFDEIQQYPEAVSSLKSFSEDGRFDVICSGSLLGVNYKKISSVLVDLKKTNNVALLDDILIYGYYGNYNNSYVIRLSDTYNDYPEVIKEFKINDVLFQYSGLSFLVWVDE